MELPGLKPLREREGLSLRKLGDLSGVSFPSIHKIEHGGEARQGTAKKLAEALGVRVEVLKTDEAERMRRQVELLEWRLRQYEKRDEQSDVLWLSLHGIASLMEKRTGDRRLRERLAYLSEKSLSKWAGLFDWPEELEEALEGEEVA